MEANIKKQADNLISLIKKEVQKEQDLDDILEEYEKEKFMCEALEDIIDNFESIELLMKYEKE